MTKLFNPKNHQHSSKAIMQDTIRSPWIILCDFDGTISLEDTTDVLLENFGMMGWQALEQDWLDGQIGSRECMGAQIALLDVSHETLYQQLAKMEIDPSFKDFVALANRYGIATQIVSDGLDSAIEFILKRNGLEHLPVFANRLVEEQDNHWSLAFPYADDQCLKASGNCKCARAANVKITPQLTSQRILYIGDGSSDFCVSNRVDLVLAKDKLIDYCREQRIAHFPIQNFNDAIALLPEILSAESAEASKSTSPSTASS
ncbi:MtnX-like HAD-IB family phosphatase [Aquirhabdus sp.]|uniref:MtnX-like HAD-IB family phosphatase n=1 Tax=Aquirhabdus sp. TaxID=2824160 RepID=UPI00396CCAFA